jgi:hypothetical protein
MFCRYCGYEKLESERCPCWDANRKPWMHQFCEKCGNPIFARQFTRKDKSGRVLILYSHPKTCEYCPPEKHHQLTEWANTLCRLYPVRIVVIRKCSCVRKKVNHHPDYSKPFEIMKLCRECHGAQHHRERAQVAQAAV